MIQSKLQIPQPPQSPQSQQDPLKISSQSIQFGSSQQIVRSLILKNIHQTMALAYKIKTNNLQALQATPNYGFIRANTAISLRIKATPNQFDAKLQINYANVGQKPGEFNQVWTSINKNNIKSRQIRVYRVGQNQISRKNRQIVNKKNIPINSSHVIRSQSLQKNKGSYRSKQSVQINQSQLANNIYDLQQKLSEQQINNAKIKQRLQITQQKLKVINQQRLQIKVNKSIGIICQDYHTSFTTLLLFGLAVFVIGYILAKWER